MKNLKRLIILLNILMIIFFLSNCSDKVKPVIDSADIIDNNGNVVANPDNIQNNTIKTYYSSCSGKYEYTSWGLSGGSVQKIVDGAYKISEGYIQIQSIGSGDSTLTLNYQWTKSQWNDEKKQNDYIIMPESKAITIHVAGIPATTLSISANPNAFTTVPVNINLTATLYPDTSLVTWTVSPNTGFNWVGGISTGKNVTMNIITSQNYSIYANANGINSSTIMVQPISIALSTINIFNPDGSWQALTWPQVILRNQNICISASGIGNDINAPETVDVIVKTSATYPSGVIKTLTETGNNTGIFRGTFPAIDFLSSITSDGIQEYVSIDFVTGAGNYNDSDRFNSKMDNLKNSPLYSLWFSRGLAKNDGNYNTTPKESQVNTSFFKAGGVEYIWVEQGSITSATKQIQNQANYLYYSGHGFHDTGDILLTDNPYDNDIELNPIDLAGQWNQDIGVIIFSGCSVFDINDYNNNFADTAHTASPGLIWKNTGALYYLGYNFTAPTDSQDGDIYATATIIENFIYDKFNSGLSLFDAWKNANDIEMGHNACAIDKNNGLYGYFQKQLVILPTPHYEYSWVVVNY